ncbi:hypothetical protein [Pseudonocardia zijingensis]|uniref:DNA-binding phage zinc finger domain-containing protein n=1 Tax=Pseudonocardia zijingensis TaxID=153376 RepID=A0ABP3YNY1_9PSEU
MTEIDRYGHPVERIRPERPAPPPPLTPAEIGGLLDLVVGYTGREPDKTLVEIWAAQSLLGRWTYSEAARAIHLWGANRGPNDFLQPADVTRAIRAERQDRAMRQPQPVPDPIGQQRLRELIDGAFQAITDDPDDPSDAARRAALQHACDYCGAKPSEPCTRQGLSGRVRLAKVHPSRLETGRERAS